MAIEKSYNYRVSYNVLQGIPADEASQHIERHGDSLPLTSASALKTYLNNILDEAIVSEAMDPGTLYVISMSVVRGATFTNVETTP